MPVGLQRGTRLAVTATARYLLLPRVFFASISFQAWLWLKGSGEASSQGGGAFTALTRGRRCGLIAVAMAEEHKGPSMKELELEVDITTAKFKAAFEAYKVDFGHEAPTKQRAYMQP